MSETRFQETNPYVLSGEWERIYICELEVGDILIDGDVVSNITHGNNRRTTFYVNGDDYPHTWGNPLSTILVKASK